MSELVEICPSCATRAVPGAAYCHRCGTPLIAEIFVHEGDEPRDSKEPGEPGPSSVPAGESEAFDFEGVHDTDVSRDFEGAPGSGPQAGTGAAGGSEEPRGSGPRAYGSEPSANSETQGGRAAGGPGAGPELSATPTSAPDPALARALSGRYEIRMADWMSRGWTVFTSAGGLFIAFATILWLLFTFAGPILLIIGPLISSGFLCAGLILRRGERVRFSDFWLPFNDFLPLFLAGIVSCALLCAGLFTCGIVTVYLWVGYQFAYLLVLDRRMDFWEALETSRKVVTRRWLSLFVFAVLLGLINVLTFLLTATVGMILSVPLTSCFLVEAYADIFGIRGGLRRDPGMAPAPAPIAARDPLPTS